MKTLCSSLFESLSKTEAIRARKTIAYIERELGCTRQLVDELGLKLD